MEGSVEVTLGDGLESVPHARRLVAEALDGDAPVDDAVLVATELVTNAVLHGSPPVELRVRRNGPRVRIEVEDASASQPVRALGDPGAMTGRGLAVVEALSSSWGVDPLASGGKVVWAELGGDPRPGAEVSDDIDALIAAWSDDPGEGELLFVELGEVPTDLLAEAKAHVDNLARELTLEAAGSGDRPLSPELAALADVVVNGFEPARTQLKRQAVQAAARGDVVTRLSLVLPAGAAEAGEAYLRRSTRPIATPVTPAF
ncbi:MAG TPA: ATP-binding protein [Acidimicrobiales bacterium]|nr:ATP-binding protein [Acidimicrobiales bacterium]